MVQHIFLYKKVDFSRNFFIFLLFVLQASEYAKCVVAKENLKKDDCVQEFQRFNKCFKQAVSIDGSHGRAE